MLYLYRIGRNRMLRIASGLVNEQSRERERMCLCVRVEGRGVSALPTLVLHVQRSYVGIICYLRHLPSQVLVDLFSLFPPKRVCVWREGRSEPLYARNFELLLFLRFRKTSRGRAFFEDDRRPKLVCIHDSTSAERDGLRRARAFVGPLPRQRGARH